MIIIIIILTIIFFKCHVFVVFKIHNSINSLNSTTNTIKHEFLSIHLKKIPRKIFAEYNFYQHLKFCNSIIICLVTDTKTKMIC